MSGTHAIFMAKILGATRVVVFEPNPPAMALLRANVALNHCHNIDLKHVGVALSDGPSRLSGHPQETDNLGGYSFVPDELGTVPCVAGDELLLHEKPVFLKIDVEGMEMAVLGGLV